MPSAWVAVSSVQQRPKRQLPRLQPSLRRQPLLHLHADSPGELAYALDYAMQDGEIVRIG